MARHKLSKAEQLAGLEKALANPRTPKQFRASMIRQRDRLRRELGK